MIEISYNIDIIILMNDIKLLNQILPGIKGKLHLLKGKKGLPAWITSSAQLYTLRVDNNRRIYLIEPKDTLEFDQLVNLHKQIEKKLGGSALIVADNLNSKFRPLFVRNRVPYVYKDKSIYAPRWGMKLIDYKEIDSPLKKIIQDPLKPFEVKLIAGFLTGFIEEKDYNLDDLASVLTKKKYHCSKSKISTAIKHLIETGFVRVQGKGPNRLVRFLNKTHVWEELEQQKIKPMFKTIEAPFVLPRKKLILSGETALAQYSDLSPPDQAHVALTNKEFTEIENAQKPGMKENAKAIIFEVFKEQPRLFAIDGYLNPIELYLTLKDHPDERVRLCLKQMLKEFKLNVWRDP